MKASRDRSKVLAEALGLGPDCRLLWGSQGRHPGLCKQDPGLRLQPGPAGLGPAVAESSADCPLIVRCCGSVACERLPVSGPPALPGPHLRIRCSWGYKGAGSGA